MRKGRRIHKDEEDARDRKEWNMFETEGSSHG